MDPITALEVYGALFEVYKAYATRSIILAAFVGFCIGVSITMIMLLLSLLRENKPKKEKKKKDKEDEGSGT